MNATLSPNDEPDDPEIPRVPEKRRSGPPPRTLQQLKMARSAAGDSQEIHRATDAQPPAPTPPTRPRPKRERPTASERPVDPEPAASPSPHLANLLQRWTGSRRGLHLALQAAALLFLGSLMASFGLGFLLGRDMGQVQDNPTEGIQITKPVADPADLKKLDVALRALRNGDPAGAGALLDELLASPARLPSLHYAAALTAAHEQNRSRARQFAEASIAAGERLSDSYALLAAVSTSGDFSGDHREFDLRTAIAADPMNERPYVELAALKRSSGSREEARRLLESAKVRLLPVNFTTVIETTLGLLRIADLPDSDLPPPSEPTGQAEKDFPAAFVEMRRGDFTRAALFLSALKNEESPDLFSYLIQDPLLTHYATEKGVAQFFRDSSGQ